MMNEATRRQINAADPRASTWVSANAGSGKTRVLTDRVARLLLDGVEPSNILCLTYTKAAASEMQNRLFKRLGEWAMMPDVELRNALREMGADPIDEAPDLSVARRLFATAIEVPGGLRIQTIHAFCSSILRRFPLEAGISPQFTEMEDRAAELLREEVLDQVAEGPDHAVLDALAQHVWDDQLMNICAEVISHKRAFLEKPTRAQLAEAFGVSADLTVSALLDDVFQPSDRKTIEDVRALCAGGSSTDQGAAGKLSDLSASGSLTLADLRTLEDVCLTGKSSKSPFSAKIGSFPTKGTREKSPALIDDLNDLMERVEAARPRRIGLEGLERTLLLHDFARVYIPAYETRKLHRGLLDFDDLINKARDLLTDPVVASWILFKLDGGIDHILVDEAQDTSPAQWEVIKALAGEFAAGDGAHADRSRTIFVVGDKKQSIYSFQGADPDEFDRMRDHFGTALENREVPLKSTELQYSFRSSHAILSFVDRTFTGPMTEGLEAQVQHHAFKSEMPGRVDLWPMIPKPEVVEKKDWFDPIDLKQEEAAEVKLARQIAEQIKSMIDNETIPEEIGNSGTYIRRPIRPRDILVLVQRRKDLFNEVIRACKNIGLPIAGADRLVLSAQLAVKDILALLRFLALAEDDLSLAATLKSPLFGWSEQDLFRLAHWRKGYLWEALRDSVDATETRAVLDDLRRQSDFLRPYDLIDRILTRHDGRRKLVRQLGAEAEDAIDALLSQALSYEQGTVPSLTGFLHWMDSDEVTVKRQMDSASDEIRVMTVHGSKGLEAPIVILPETQFRKIDIRNEVLETEHGPIWKTSSENTPDTVRPVVDDLKATQEKERRRLLYVALTRAEKWLIICGAGEAKEGNEAWFNVIEAAMGHVGAEAIKQNGIDILRYSAHDWDAPELQTVTDVQTDTVPAPKLPAIDTVPSRKATISPSDLGGAKALPGEVGQADEDVSLARGRLVHMLLEHLPAYPIQDRLAVGTELIASDPDSSLVEDRDNLLSDVVSMLERPELEHIFSPDSLAEVEISAEIPELENRIHGAIDRLIVRDSQVLCVDFKTNRKVPANAEQTPEGILRQMGAYLSGLSHVYPDHEISCAILWTATGELMDLPPDLVMAALRRAASG